ncbi:MAG: cytochrome c biogenesis CcdA family protein [Bacillota bacterium]
MDLILQGLSNPFLGPVFAVVAGILASASPCAMSAVPLMVAHIAGARPEARKRQTALFVLGMTIALSVTGMVAGLLGKSLLFAAPWIRWIAGIAFVIAGLSYLEMFGSSKTCDASIPLEALLDEDGDDVSQAAVSGDIRQKGCVGASLRSIGLGMLYGLSASPCSTPALIAILTIVASTGSVIRGGLLLLAYSLGQSVLVLFAGLFATQFTEFLESERNTLLLDILRKAGGVIIAGFGVYLMVRPYL